MGDALWPKAIESYETSDGRITSPARRAGSKPASSTRRMNMTYDRTTIDRLITTVDSGLAFGELAPYAQALRDAVAEVDDMTGWRESCVTHEETIRRLTKERAELRVKVEQLTAEVAAMRPVVEAADNITRVKREAEKVFNTGLSGMYAMTQSSPLAKGLAKATASAGKKLEHAVDAYRASKAGVR